MALVEDDVLKALEVDTRETMTQLPPKHTTLLQNYPNPFNPETWIPFQLAKEAEVVIQIYNIKGELVRVLSIGHKSAGCYLSKEKAVFWNGKNQSGEAVANGLYFYTLKAGEFQATRKMILVK
ncbi:T9SS type A sorting domain-containing protein [Candidatus Poribacteria bacterium]|nr:T9SS type A sorting domain-containing protein [Candidatus Poribacteria bacterium]